MHITQAFLRERYGYDPVSGVLSWRVRGCNSVRVGDPVGSINGEGYLCTTIFGRAFKVHRLVWMHVTGEWPTSGLDHENSNRADNRWRNLRCATPLQNAHNRQRRNESGYRGVSRQPSTPNKPWRAVLYTGRRCEYLGCYLTAEEAARAFDRAARERRGDFARLNFPAELARAEGK